MTLNVATFPEPPTDSHLIDVGPLIGIWYLVVTIRIALSLKWVTEQHR